MNKYLLLRDNKQSGPYSVDELEKLGLKPYDLVWLDGRSAAWRYPSEIDELKHFAPVVEEQPYDRFYKKKTTQQNTAAQPITNDIAQNETVQTAATVVTTPVTDDNTPRHITAKKIYVTLPAGTGSRSNTNTATTTNNGKSEQAKAQTAEQEANAKLLNEKFARLREEKIKQAEEMAAYQPVANKATSITTATATPVPAVGFSEIVEQHHPRQEEILAPVHLHSSNNNKLLMRSIVAACLVLGGIIIGLFISNSRQQKNNAALDEIVRKIQEREKRLQLATQTVATPIQADITANDPVAAGQQEPPAELTGNKQEPADKPVDVPAKKTVPATKETQPVKDEQEQNIEIIPAVVTSKPEEKPANHQEIEKTRRNIHQLVSIDANKYKTGVLGGISGLKLTLSNNSLYPLDEVEVEVRYLGPEKRVVKTQLLRFSELAAGEQKTVEAPNTNRGVTVDYIITRINSKALGLAHAGY